MIRRISVIAAMMAASLCAAQFASFVPSDASHPPAAELQQLLHQICPGHENASGCASCPDSAGWKGDGIWDLGAVLFGHFVSPSSDDALVSGIGCGDHANGSGGSFLLTRSSSGWQLMNYGPGRIANDCAKLRALGGRDLLVCGTSFGHSQIGESFLYLLDPADSDFRKRVDGLDIFFMVNDSLSGCTAMLNGLAQSGRIDRVALSRPSSAGAVEITIDAQLGQAVISEAALNDCQNRAKPGDDVFQPKMKTEARRFVFTFDGKAVRPDPGNPPMSGVEAVMPDSSAVLPKEFRAADGSFAITVPPLFRAISGTELQSAESLSGIPVCARTDLVCIVYPADDYKGTGFEAAAIEVKNTAATSAAACVLDGFTMQSSAGTGVGGANWAFRDTNSAVAGHKVTRNLSRTWHGNRCWELSVNIAQLDAGHGFTRADYDEVALQLNSVVWGFQFRK
jgi:hypothetical protein